MTHREVWVWVVAEEVAHGQLQRHGDECSCAHPSKEAPRVDAHEPTDQAQGAPEPQGYPFNEANGSSPAIHHGHSPSGEGRGKGWGVIMLADYCTDPLGG